MVLRFCPVAAAALVAPFSPLDAGESAEPGPRKWGDRVAIGLPTGDLAWTLPMGTVPGDIPIVATFRFKASGFGSALPAPGEGRRGPVPPSCRGIGGSLHFGYLVTSADEPGGSPTLQGFQVLEDGTEFREGDWQSQAADGGLPAAFGFGTPSGGYAMDGSRTRGTYSASLQDLGTWSRQVAMLTPEKQFRVVLDRERARVFAFQPALGFHVPVLWVDRFGHWVEFQWRSGGSPQIGGLAVRVLNQRSQGIEVAWPARANFEEEGDLLRADFIGMPGPSLLVRGFAGSYPRQSIPLGEGIGSLVGRPTRILLGPSERLPVTREEPVASPLRQWAFSYTDSRAVEVASLLEPSGVKTCFTFQTYAFPGEPGGTRGVSEAVSTDLVTGATQTRTWTREMPSGPGEPWTVRAFTGYSDGQPTEGRHQKYTFVDLGLGPERGLLQAHEILGESGIARQTFYEHADKHGRLKAVRTTATGAPGMERLRTLDPTSGRPVAESLRMGGEEVEVRTFTYDVPPESLGADRPASVAVRRGKLPEVKECWSYSIQDRLLRHTTQAGGAEKGRSFAYDGEGRQVQGGWIASWAPTGVPVEAFQAGPFGPVSRSLSGPGLQEPLVESWEYDAAGRLIGARDALGNRTAVTYDLWGRPISVVRTGEPEWTCAYPDERTRTWRQGGLHGSEHVDGFGRLRSRLREDGVEETFGYDTQGRQVWIREHQGDQVRLVSEALFDALDRTIQERIGTEPPTACAYHSEGIHQVVAASGAQGTTTNRLLDPWGQEVSHSLDSVTTRTAYNEFGQPTRIERQEPGGRTQTRGAAFDGMGNLVWKSDPETGTTAFSRFDAFGQPGLEVDASGRTVTRTFDAAGRLVTQWGGGLGLTNFFKGAFLTGRVSSDGVSQCFTYGGPGGRLDSETLVAGGTKRTVRYAYDERGALRQIAYPGGRRVAYGHDDLGRITTIMNDGKLLARIGYDDWGTMARLEFASGARSDWWRDAAGRLERWDVSHAGGTEHRDYRSDELGHLTLAGEWVLKHDAQGRLIGAKGLGLSTSHGYDGFGNGTLHTAQGDVPKGFNSFQTEVQLDSRFPGIQANGALTGWVVEANGETSHLGHGVASKGGLELGWDAYGRLAALKGPETEQHYHYAPSGLRIGLQDARDPKKDRQYFYTEEGNLLSEYHGQGRWVRDVIHLGSLAIAEVDAEGVHELHSDPLGTPRVITGGGCGAVEGRQAFGPYGEAIDIGSHTEGYRPLTGFTGHLQTEATGLIYMRGRFYSPAWHRFLNSDRGLDPASWNQFAYVGGSPFSATDPSGFMQRPSNVPRFPDGMINGGGATVPVVDFDPGPLRTIPVPPRFPGHFPPVMPLPMPAPFFNPHFPVPIPGTAPTLLSQQGGRPVPHPAASAGSAAAAPAAPPQPPPPPPKVSNPGTADGKVASAMGKGDYKAAFGQMKVQANQQKIRELQRRNDSMKTQTETQAIRDYITSVGTDVVKAAVLSGAICGEAGAAIGAVLGLGVGAVPGGGFGAVGGAIVAGVGALSYTGVVEGIKLQKTLSAIKNNWAANYRAVQNYSDTNCAGAPPEIRY